MHIGIAGPIATSDILHLLDANPGNIPCAMQGSSLLATLVEAFVMGGHQVSVFTTDSSLPIDGDIFTAFGQNLVVYYAPARRRAFSPECGRFGRMTDFFALERSGLLRCMKMAAPDIIHAHWQYEYSWAALDSGIPTLVTCHDAPIRILRMMPDLYRLGRLCMAFLVLRRVRAATVVSPYLIPEIHRFTSVPLDVVPNPVPMPTDLCSRSVDGKFDISRNPKILMVLNSTHALKNAERGFRAFALFQRRWTGATLEVVGRGYEVGGIGERMAIAAGLVQGLKLVGQVPYMDVLERMKSADLLLHPSLEESFGMTVAEAMSHGLPVVAGRNSGAIPWLLANSAGELVDVRSAEEMCEGMDRVLSTPKVYASISKTARLRAESMFSITAVKERYLSIYDSVLSM